MAVPGEESSLGDGAQRDQPELWAPLRPLAPGSLAVPVTSPESRSSGPSPAGPAAGRRNRARSNQRERSESLVPSSLAPGPAFGLLKALLQQCQFSLIHTSKPELPNILGRLREFLSSVAGREAEVQGGSEGLLRARQGSSGQVGRSDPLACAHRAPREVPGAQQGRLWDVSGQGHKVTGHGTQCSGLVGNVVITQRLDLIILEVFSN